MTLARRLESGIKFCLRCTRGLIQSQRQLTYDWGCQRLGTMDIISLSSISPVRFWPIAVLKICVTPQPRPGTWSGSPWYSCWTCHTDNQVASLWRLEQAFWERESREWFGKHILQKLFLHEACIRLQREIEGTVKWFTMAFACEMNRRFAQGSVLQNVPCEVEMHFSHNPERKKVFTKSRARSENTTQSSLTYCHLVNLYCINIQSNKNIQCVERLPWLLKIPSNRAKFIVGNCHIAKQGKVSNQGKKLLSRFPNIIQQCSFFRTRIECTHGTSQKSDNIVEQKVQSSQTAY